MDLTVTKIAANARYIMMNTQKYTIVMYSLLDPPGRLPKDKTKQVTKVAR
jgi:hypothetical protein